MRVLGYASYVSSRMRLHGRLTHLRLGWLVYLFALAFSQPLLAESSRPALAQGASIEAGQWRVKPLRARRVTEHPLRHSPAKSESYLLIECEFANLTERSSGDYRSVVRLEQPEFEQLGEPVFVLARDMALSDRLHPDMPETLLIVWPLPAGMSAPPELKLSIYAKTYKPVDNLVGSPGWFNPAAVANATLTLGTE